MEKYAGTIKILRKYKQEHLINLLNNLDEKKSEELIEQISHIDLDMIMKLYKTTQNKFEKKNSKIEYIEYLDKESLDKKEKEKLDKLGKNIIKNGKYAVVTMAGGQGTRLGHNGPKGTFKLDVGENGKFLFEILAENLKEANKRYNVLIPWYIMTSKENHNETCEFLEKHEYFGYDKKSVMLFSQGELPLIDTKGKMLIRRRF